VEKNTPAEISGLKKGDVIIDFNGKTIPNVAKFRIEVANSPIDVEIPVRVFRDKKEITLYVKLVSRPDEEPVIPIEEESSIVGYLGLEVEGLKGEFARERNVEEEDGVIITRIEPDSPGARSGLLAGDIILEINQKVVKDVDKYKELVSELENDLVLLYIKTSDGNYQFITIKLGND